jgi:hypothetical protein
VEDHLARINQARQIWASQNTETVNLVLKILHEEQSKYAERTVVTRLPQESLPEDPMKTKANP